MPPAIGTMLGAFALLRRIAIEDWLTILVGVGALLALSRWKVSNPLLMAVTALLGLIAFPLLHVMVRGEIRCRSQPVALGDT